MNFVVIHSVNTQKKAAELAKQLQSEYTTVFVRSSYAITDTELGELEPKFVKHSRFWCILAFWAASFATLIATLSSGNMMMTAMAIVTLSATTAYCYQLINKSQTRVHMIIWGNTSCQKIASIRATLGNKFSEYVVDDIVEPISVESAVQDEISARFAHIKTRSTLG